MKQLVAVFATDAVQGEVLCTQLNPHKVVIVATFTRLPPGDHGFHIHKAGDLRGEGCKLACDHFHKGPPSIHGGPPNSRGPRHTGDLGNIDLSKRATYTYILPNLTLDELVGRSFIVHADPDDLGKGDFPDSKTTGHSGTRIACAVIGRTNCPVSPSKRRYTLRSKILFKS